VDPVVRTGNDGANGEADDVEEFVAACVLDAGVGEVGEEREQRERLRLGHGSLPCWGCLSLSFGRTPWMASLPPQISYLDAIALIDTLKQSQQKLVLRQVC
jgi:hypothetical protein